MICVNCGMCCVDYDVIIINPKAISKDGNVNLNDDKSYIHKGSGKACPHLYWDDEKSQCHIHNYEWYKKTPCYDFGQIESSKDDICRIGYYLVDNNLHKKYIGKICVQSKK